MGCLFSGAKLSWILWAIKDIIGWEFVICPRTSLDPEAEEVIPPFRINPEAEIFAVDRFVLLPSINPFDCSLITDREKIGSAFAVIQCSCNYHFSRTKKKGFWGIEGTVIQIDFPQVFQIFFIEVQQINPAWSQNSRMSPIFTFGVLNCLLQNGIAGVVCQQREKISATHTCDHKQSD